MTPFGCHCSVAVFIQLMYITHIVSQWDLW